MLEVDNKSVQLKTNIDNRHSRLGSGKTLAEWNLRKTGCHLCVHVGMRKTPGVNCINRTEIFESASEILE